MENKKWWKSKTMWGGFLMAVAFILNYFHYELSPADQTILIDTIPETIEAISGAFGVIMTIWGRVTVKAKLTT